MNRESRKRRRKNSSDIDDDEILEMQKEINDLIACSKYSKKPSIDLETQAVNTQVSYKDKVNTLNELDESELEDDSELEMKYEFESTGGIVINSSEIKVTNIQNCTINTLNVNVNTKNISVKKNTKIKLWQDPKAFYGLTNEIIMEKIKLLTEITTNRAEKLIGILVKNMYNVETPCKFKSILPIDVSLQEVLEKWRDWLLYKNGKCLMGDPPLFYKCLICTLAWWTFYDYREHMFIHDKVTFNIEIIDSQCNIIGYQGSKPKKSILIPINSNCLKCDMPEKKHLSSKKRQYKCRGCHISMGSCDKLQSHLRNCPSYLDYLKQRNFIVDLPHKCYLCTARYTNNDDLLKHMTYAHSVRSDIPVMWEKKKCSSCGIPCEKYSLHECAFRKRYGALICKHCSRLFSYENQLQNHYIFNEGGVKCEICNEVIQTKCAMLNHLYTHSENYVMLYRCLRCDSNTTLYKNYGLFKEHKTMSHAKKNVTKQYQEVLVPKQCIEMCKQISDIDITEEDMVETEDPMEETPSVSTSSNEDTTCVIDTEDKLLKQEVEDCIYIEKEEDLIIKEIKHKL